MKINTLFKTSDGRFSTLTEGPSQFPVGYIGGIYLTPNKEFLIEYSADYKNSIVNIISFKTYELLHTIKDFNRRILAVALSPDGKYLVSGSYDKQLKIWEIKSGKLIKNLEGHKGQIRGVDVSPDGNYIVSAGAYKDYFVGLWDFNTGELIKKIKNHKKNIFYVKFAQKGKILLSASEDRSIISWDLKRNKKIYTLIKHPSWDFKILTSADEKYLIADSKGRIRVYNLKTGEALWLLEGKKKYFYHMQVSPDSKYLAACSYDKSVRVWDLATGALVNVVRNEANDLQTVVFAPDGRTVFSVTANMNFIIWDLLSGKFIWETPKQEGYISEILETTEGNYIAYGASETEILVWKLLMQPNDSITKEMSVLDRQFEIKK